MLWLVPSGLRGYAKEHSLKTLATSPLDHLGRAPTHEGVIEYHVQLSFCFGGDGSELDHEMSRARHLTAQQVAKRGWVAPVRGRDALLLRFALSLVGGDEQPLLRAEIVVNEPVVHAGLSGDLLYRYPLHALA